MKTSAAHLASPGPRGTAFPRFADVARLVRLDRPIGIYLALGPTLWALWMAARGQPRISLLVVTVLGIPLVRSALCALNDYADRDFDGRVQRTRDRPLVTGRLTPVQALIVSGTLFAIGALGLLATNALTVALAVPGTCLVCLYPFAKRYTHWPQLVLGAMNGWVVPLAFAAQTNSVPPRAWIAYAAIVAWTTAYDTIYALLDRDDDRLIGVKSTAVLFGEHAPEMIASFHSVAIVALVAFGISCGLGPSYYAAVVGAAGLFLHQQRLVQRATQEAYFTAFRRSHWLGWMLLVGTALGLPSSA